ncbi:MAG TPA: hypothetical protein VNK46_05615 [Nitrospiraceae bacterium]|jgi:hypothetical protein|nr:hypothetical protein [Nitrospiraceae bacterium]
MRPPDRSLDGLPAEVKEPLRAYMPEVLELFGSTLEGLVLYGSAARGEYLPGRSNLNLLFLLATGDAETLRRYGKIHRRWSKEQIVVPLFMTRSEFEASAALFPLEFLEMKEHHRLLAGWDPFPGLSVDLRLLPFQVEQGLRSHLLRLRQRFVEGSGTVEAVTILLPLSLTTLFPCLRGLLRVMGCQAPTASEAALKEVQSSLQCDTAAFVEVFNLKRGLISPGPAEVPRMFVRYVACLEALVRRVDEWKAKGVFPKANEK